MMYLSQKHSEDKALVFWMVIKLGEVCPDERGARIFVRFIWQQKKMALSLLFLAHTHQLSVIKKPSAGKAGQA